MNNFEKGTIEYILEALPRADCTSSRDFHKAMEAIHKATKEWGASLSSDAKDEGGETVYDQLSELHDKICDEMEKITLEQIDTDGFFLGQYRAYRRVIKMIKKYDVVATPPPSLSAENIMMKHCSDNGLLSIRLGKAILAAMEEYRTVGERPKEDLTVADDVFTRLIALYRDNPVCVAMVCDDVLDRSGALLGRVRDVAIKERSK